MGQTLQPLDSNFSDFDDKNNKTIPFSITPQKASFNYIKPLVYFQQNQITNLIEQHQQSQQQSEKKKCKKIQSIKQIKVKWNSFIKMKQKDYLVDYDIVKKIIGRGGFGVVRKVKSKYTHNVRVAKCIEKKLLNQDDVNKLFAELFIMKMLDHPHIIKLFQVYYYDEQFVLILQICSGGEVFTSGRSKKFEQHRAATIIKQLLRTLIYLHSQNIVHRDIKPQNMLFENEDKKVVKLIDFGIAIKMKENQVLNDRIGTPLYVAPEIIYKQYNQKCDVWATGITMYQLIAGKTPFYAENQTETMRQILRAPLQFTGPVWEKVTPECKEVIKLMLSKKAEQRPSAKQLFENSYFISIVDKDEKNQQQGDDKKLAIQKMQNFTFKNKLQAVVRTYMASQLLTKQEKEVLVGVFKQFDTNSDGVISTEQLRQALAEKRNISVEKIDGIMRVVDINGSGQIDYTQFLVANCENSLQFTRERLKHVFKYFDSDHNGLITYNEVSEFLQDYQSTDDEIKKIFLMVDANGDGSVSEDEFIDLLIDKMQQFSCGFSMKLSIAESQNEEDKEDLLIKKRQEILRQPQNSQYNTKARRLTGFNANQIMEIFQNNPISSPENFQ